MAILGSDLLVKGTVTSGAAGNTVANGGAGTNLGKYCSTSTLTDNILNNLFPDATGDENAASNVDYQAIYIVNNNASLTWQNVFAWQNTDVAGGATYAIGVDPAAVSLIGAAAAQGATIASKNTAPAGVVFTTPITKAAGVSIGNVAPLSGRVLWVQRTCTNSAALNNDGCQLRAEGDTVA